jgi:hypothetical protein
LTQVSAGQIGPTQIRLTQGGFFQSGLAEVSPGQVKRRQFQAGQIAVSQIQGFVLRLLQFDKLPDISFS